MIDKLEGLFIKVWRAASILSVFFSGLIASSMTAGIDQGGERFLIVVGVVICAAMFAGVTAWAMRILDQVAASNKIAEKQLRLSSMMHQRMVKGDSVKGVVQK